MQQMLAGGSVLAAFVGAGCCVTPRRREILVVAGMALMLLAMTETMLVAPTAATVVPALGWAIVLAGCALILSVVGFPRALARERAGQLGAMSLLIAVMGTGGHSKAPMSDMPHHSADVTVPVVVHELLTAFALPIACGWSMLLLLRGSEACCRRLRTERFAGALSLSLMATAAVLM